MLLEYCSEILFLNCPSADTSSDFSRDGVSGETRLMDEEGKEIEYQPFPIQGNPKSNPPSTVSIWPVIYLASFDTRKSEA